MPSLVTDLNDEWRRIQHDPAPSVTRWAGRHQVLTRCHSLADVLGRVPDHPDAVLLALLVECSRGDTVAGRVVIQAMLEKLILMARNTSSAEIDDFVAALWIRVATYPVNTRPQRVAANLALDTLKAVRRERPEPPVPPRPVPVAVAAPHQEPSEELSACEVIALGRSLGLITEQTGLVMHGVYVEGLSGKQAAARYGTTPAMIRYRCSDGAKRLARRSRELLAA